MSVYWQMLTAIEIAKQAIKAIEVRTWTVLLPPSPLSSLTPLCRSQHKEVNLAKDRLQTVINMLQQRR